MLTKERTNTNDLTNMWWTPLHELSMIRNTMNELLNHFLSDMPVTTTYYLTSPTTTKKATHTHEKEYSFMPTMNMWEKEDKLYMEFSLPGVSKDNINIHTTPEYLTIEGKVEMPEEMKDCSFYSYEIPFGKFKRTIEYPVEVKHEEMTAKFENGMLKICVPLMHSSKTHNIKINIE